MPKPVLRLSKGQRAVLVNRLPELANFAVGSLLFGQFLSDRPFSMLLAGVSAALWLVLMGVTFALTSQEDQ